MQMENPLKAPFSALPSLELASPDKTGIHTIRQEEDEMKRKTLRKAQLIGGFFAFWLLVSAAAAFGSGRAVVAKQNCKGGICVRTTTDWEGGKTVRRLWISGNPRPGKPLDFYQIRGIPGDIRKQVEGRGGPYAFHGSGTVSIQGCYRGTFQTFCSGWEVFMLY